MYVGGVHPVSGENRVHSLDGVDQNLSITSIVSIISTLIAPRLHRKRALRVDRMAASLPTAWVLWTRPERPAATTGKNRSLYPGRERSKQPVSSSRSVASRPPHQLVWWLDHRTAAGVTRENLQRGEVIPFISSLRSIASTIGVSIKRA